MNTHMLVVLQEDKRMNSQLRTWAWKLLPTNIVGLFFGMLTPVPWAAPFAAGLAAASGATDTALSVVLPGALCGCLLAGDPGAFLGCVLAYILARILIRLRPARCEAFSAVSGGMGCLLPAIARHLDQGFYPLATAVLAALLAMAAAPALTPLFRRDCLRARTLSADERVSLHLAAAVLVAGITRLWEPAGLFAAGLLALTLSGGGVAAGALGAFTAGVGLLIEGQGALMPSLLLISAGCAGALWAVGAWARALAFLIGIPLSYYLGWDVRAAFLLGAAVAHPLIPERFSARMRMQLLSSQPSLHARLRVTASRRHAAPEGGACGDTGAIEKAPDGRVILLLADGMGTGEGARRLSRRALALAREFLECGLNEFTAYRAINRLSDGGREAFSTLDVCEIDPVTGTARFHKCGSEPTWLLRGRTARRIEGASLPVGVVAEATPSVASAHLRPGDAIIMATDGLVNALGGEPAAEAWFQTLSTLSPAAFCTAALKEAQSRNRAARPDDMSILCARIQKRSPLLDRAPAPPDPIPDNPPAAQPDAAAGP